MDTPVRDGGGRGRRHHHQQHSGAVPSLLRPTSVGFGSGELDNVSAGLGIHLTPPSASAGQGAGNTALSPAPSLQPLQRRRGHHHKHSLSHQFFLPPLNRAPISLPAAHPIPNYRELLQSATTDQKAKFAYGLVHLLLSFVVWRFNDASSLAVVAITKVVAFDAFGLLYGAGVATAGNFACWRSSSVERPFGLRRSELVAMFGMGVYLIYTGVELFREVLERLVIGGGHSHGSSDHVHLDPHALSTPHTTPTMILVLAITALAQLAFAPHTDLATLLAIDLPKIPHPFALLSIVPAVAVVGLSSIGGQHGHLHAVEDRLLAAGLGVALFYIGARLTYRIGSILLITYPVDEVDALYDQIERDDAVVSESQTSDGVAVQGQIWQCWSDLVVVALRVTVKGGEEAETRFRERCKRYVKDILGGGYGAGTTTKFHVTIECVRAGSNTAT